MNRFSVLLDRLNHSSQPPAAQSPFKASAAVSLLSFLLICWLDRHVLSAIDVWWLELLAYGFVPILLAFIILYRSAWHQELGRVARPVLTVLASCLVFCGAVMLFALAVVLIALVYVSSFDGFMRFHY